MANFGQSSHHHRSSATCHCSLHSPRSCFWNQWLCMTGNLLSFAEFLFVERWAKGGPDWPRVTCVACPFGCVSVTRHAWLNVIARVVEWPHTYTHFRPTLTPIWFWQTPRPVERGRWHCRLSSISGAKKRVTTFLPSLPRLENVRRRHPCFRSSLLLIGKTASSTKTRNWT